MEKVEFKRQIPIYENVDVLVVGAGPAGSGGQLRKSRSKNARI